MAGHPKGRRSGGPGKGRGPRKPRPSEGLALPEIRLRLPGWVRSCLTAPGHVYGSVEERMRLAVALSRENMARGTGGPFGAAVFDMDTGRLVAPGVNLVLSSRWCGAHAEMVAFAVAQRALGTHDLGGPGMPACELVTSTEPCAMCVGAATWSGVRRIVCGARDEDAREIGFDEGAKMERWAEALRGRGIEVVRDVLREEARAVLEAYEASGGIIYNGRMR
jgi:tRNA(Arg) A34 adenosine deaminase TadA